MNLLLAERINMLYDPSLSRPWIVVRDREGRWCVESRMAWPCRVCLTSAFTATEDQQEERARSMAAALNRVYAG